MYLVQGCRGETLLQQKGTGTDISMCGLLEMTVSFVTAPYRKSYYQGIIRTTRCCEHNNSLKLKTSLISLQTGNCD